MSCWLLIKALRTKWDAGVVPLPDCLPAVCTCFFPLSLSNCIGQNDRIQLHRKCSSKSKRRMHVLERSLYGKKAITHTYTHRHTEWVEKPVKQSTPYTVVSQRWKIERMECLLCAWVFVQAPVCVGYLRYQEERRSQTVVCVCEREAGMGPCGDSCCENRSMEATAAATSGRKRAEGGGWVVTVGWKGACVCDREREVCGSCTVLSALCTSHPLCLRRPSFCSLCLFVMHCLHFLFLRSVAACFY